MVPTSLLCLLRAFLPFSPSNSNADLAGSVDRAMGYCERCMMGTRPGAIKGRGKRAAISSYGKSGLKGKGYKACGKPQPIQEEAL